MLNRSTQVLERFWAVSRQEKLVEKGRGWVDREATSSAGRKGMSQTFKIRVKSIVDGFEDG